MKQGPGKPGPFCCPRSVGGARAPGVEQVFGRRRGKEESRGALGVVVLSVESDTRKRADPVGPTLSLTHHDRQARPHLGLVVLR